MDQNNYLDALERAMVAGNLVLIEGARDTIYLVLEPLLSRQTVKKGQFTRWTFCDGMIFATQLTPLTTCCI